MAPCSPQAPKVERLRQMVDAMLRENGSRELEKLELSREESAWLLNNFDAVQEIAMNERRVAELQKALLATIPGRLRKVLPIRHRR